MPCASGRSDPSCGGLLDCQSTRAPISLNRQPIKHSIPQRGLNRLGGQQPGASTYTTVGGGGGAPQPLPRDLPHDREGRENNYDNGTARGYTMEARSKVAFQAQGPPDVRPGLLSSRPVLDLQEQRRQQSQQSADELAEQRRWQAAQAQQALQQAQAQQQAQREQMARERENMEREQARRQQLQQQQPELQRKQMQQPQQQSQQQYARPPEEEPHWVRKVRELSKISSLFPLTMAPPADNDFFLYPHLDHENKRDPQQRRPMMPRQPGAVDRRKSAAEEHEEMVVALRDALEFGTVHLTQPLPAPDPHQCASGIMTPVKQGTSSGHASPHNSGAQWSNGNGATHASQARESPSRQIYSSVSFVCASVGRGGGRAYV